MHFLGVCKFLCLGYVCNSSRTKKLARTCLHTQKGIVYCTQNRVSKVDTQKNLPARIAFRLCLCLTGNGLHIFFVDIFFQDSDGPVSYPEDVSFFLEYNIRLLLQVFLFFEVFVP